MNPLKVGYFVLFFALSGALASALTKQEGKIFIYNDGAYSAKFSVSYDLKGESKSKSSEEFKKGENRVLSIPSEATNILLAVEKLGSKGSQIIFTQHFSSPPQKCYRIEGTILSSGYAEISCVNVERPNLQQIWTSLQNAEDDSSYVSVENLNSQLVKFSIRYELNGKIESHSSGEYASKARTISIPNGAANVQLKVEVLFFGGSWGILASESFPGPARKCYKVSGTSLNPQIAEHDCVLKKTSSQQAATSKNANDEDGYFTMENNVDNSAVFTVGYDLNGKYESHSSDALGKGEKGTLLIPSGASHVFLTIQMYLSPGKLTTMAMQPFPEPVQRCYKLMSILFDTTVAIVPCSFSQ